jgi:hypothetical protein
LRYFYYEKYRQTSAAATFYTEMTRIKLAAAERIYHRSRAFVKTRQKLTSSIAAENDREYF